MLSFSATAALGNVWIIATNSFALEYLQLKIETFQFGADVVGTHIGKSYFTNVDVTIVAC